MFFLIRSVVFSCHHTYRISYLLAISFKFLDSFSDSMFRLLYMNERLPFKPYVILLHRKIPRQKRNLFVVFSIQSKHMCGCQSFLKWIGQNESIIPRVTFTSHLTWFFTHLADNQNPPKDTPSCLTVFTAQSAIEFVATMYISN